MKHCSICGCQFDGFGNNSAPLKRGECCKKCDDEVVLPLRLFFAGAMKNALLVLGEDNGITYHQINSDHAELKLLQKLVGGYIELYPYDSDRFYLIVDEDGYPKNRQFNGLANEIFNIIAVGNVVVCPKELFE